MKMQELMQGHLFYEFQIRSGDGQVQVNIFSIQ